jgi:hypothetical protein
MEMILAEAAAMDWMTIATQFGVPVAFLAAILYGGSKAAQWTALNVVQPIVAAHRQFLEATLAQSNKVASDLASFQEQSSKQSQTISDNIEIIKDTNVRAAVSLSQIVSQLPTVCRVPPTLPDQKKA